jgi:23S rRNA (guanosine2251-2'-O)-methyltransferase
MDKIANEQLGRLSNEEFKIAPKLPIAIVLDQVRSLHNVGSVFRSADAFRVSEICLCGITATPPHREINKTALGATDSVAWKYFETTEAAIEQLKEKVFIIIAIEQTFSAISLQAFTWDKEKKYAFVFGHEMDGVSDAALALSDFSIVIDQHGTKHSLNIAVCAGIVLYTASQAILTS